MSEASARVDELRDLVTQCRQVIADEVRLLDHWLTEPTLPPGRAADARHARRTIAIGPSSPEARVDWVLGQVGLLQDASDSGPAHQAAVDATRASIDGRRNWSGSGLSDPMWDNALLIAEGNSEQSATNAEAFYQ